MTECENPLCNSRDLCTACRSRTRQTTLADLLPEDAIAELIGMAELGRYSKRDLMPVIERYRSELLAKGVDADYLGYVLELQFGRMLEDADPERTPGKGSCFMCGLHNRLEPSLLCQMCQGDVESIAAQNDNVVEARFPAKAFPVKFQLYSRLGHLLWERTVEKPDGLVALAIPGYAGTEHVPVSVRITQADGTVITDDGTVTD